MLRTGVLARVFMIGFGISTIVTLPFWWSYFSRTGSAFDKGFVERTILLGRRLPYIDYCAGILSMLLVAFAIASLLFIIIRKRNKLENAAIGVLFAFAAIPTINYLRIDVFSISVAKLGGSAALLTIGVLAVGLVIWLALRPRTVFRAIEGAVSILAIVGIVTVLNAVVAVARTMPLDTFPLWDNRSFGGVPKREHDLSPVIWIIFDEWDYRFAFDARPKDLTMPAVDRLRQESFFATKAVPPGGETAVSIPALTTGLPVVGSVHGRGGGLVLGFANGKKINWGTTDSVFDHARELGAQITILSHQYGPYCGTFHRALTSCWEIGRWWPERQNALGAVVYVLSYGLRYMPLVRNAVIRFYDPDYRRINSFDPVNVFEAYQREVERRLRYGKDDLLYLHYELPHEPVLYDRRSKRFRAEPKNGGMKPDGYADNLALVDQVVARLRAVLEQANRWDKVTLVVSSDHHWRKELPGVRLDLRVPYIVKLPSVGHGVTYEKPMNTAVTTKLIPALLSRRFESYQTLEEFISARGSSDGVGVGITGNGAR